MDGIAEAKAVPSIVYRIQDYAISSLMFDNPNVQKLMVRWKF